MKLTDEEVWLSRLAFRAALLQYIASLRPPIPSAVPIWNISGDKHA